MDSYGSDVTCFLVLTAAVSGMRPGLQVFSTSLAITNYL